MSHWISRVAAALAVMGFCVSAATAAPIIGLNFSGASLSDGAALKGFGYAPPDTMGAVGPNHIVEFINGVYATYNKTTGALVGSMISDTQFWVNAGLAQSGLSDPRILYDPSSGRWFACQITTSQATNNNIYIARSNSSDPTAGWSGVALSVTNSRFADYPTLGLDADGVYIGTNDFTSISGSFSNESVYSIPKADLLLGVPSLTNLTRFDALNASTVGFTIQAAVDYGPSKGRTPLLAVDNDFFGQIDRTNLLNTSGPGPATMSATTTINVAATSFPPQARQPDGTAQIDTLDERFSANVYYQVGNLLYMVHDISAAGRAAIRWTILNELTNALVQEGTLSDPNYDLFQPSIAANANGDVVIGFNRSGLTENISAYAVVGTTAGTVVTFGPAMLLKQGLVGNYHLFGGLGERWGDYSATMLDPSNPNSFWTFQEYPIASNIWGTQITQIILQQSQGEVPEPATLALVALGGLGILRRRRRAA